MLTFFTKCIETKNELKYQTKPLVSAQFGIWYGATAL